MERTNLLASAGAVLPLDTAVLIFRGIFPPGLSPPFDLYPGDALRNRDVQEASCLLGAVHEMNCFTSILRLLSQVDEHE
jgi:hypothetical protein